MERYGNSAGTGEREGPEYAVTAKPLYDALLSGITWCTGTVASTKTLSELKKQKGLGRSDILALVERVQQRGRTPTEWWPTVEAELIPAGWKSVRLRRLSLACLEYTSRPVRMRSCPSSEHLAQLAA